MWRVGPVQFIGVLAWSRWRGCTGFFLGSVEVGMVRLKYWGVGLFLFSFFSCFLLFWRAVVCGMSPFLKVVLFGTILVFLVDFIFYKLVIFSYLLQVV